MLKFRCFFLLLISLVLSLNVAAAKQLPSAGAVLCHNAVIEPLAKTECQQGQHDHAASNAKMSHCGACAAALPMLLPQAQLASAGTIQNSHDAIMQVGLSRPPLLPPPLLRA
ncbi:hypothetical protein [uncultured Deefgea sp.]|uniref:hypothetical protein n=1 Tax=uncultured Deefgea sp. TaxID=1304914 RepID=UPI002591C1DA|nr:hypothetical protein [uncultured Deefgea sp.]